MATHPIALYRLSYPPPPALPPKFPGKPPLPVAEPGFTVEADAVDQIRERVVTRLRERGEVHASMSHRTDGGMTVVLYAKPPVAPPR